MLKIILAIPCYNCAPQIPRVISSLTPRLRDRLDKIVIIDNQSKDSTLEAAITAQQKLQDDRVIVVRNRKNYGLGGSHKAAFLYAQEHDADYIAILHGDDQANTEELHKLIDCATQKPQSAAILGSRFMKGSHLDGYSSTRKWGNKALNTIYEIVAQRPSKDLGSGLNLFRVQDLRDQQYLSFSDGMTFNIDLLLHYFELQTALEFVPITWRENDQRSNAKNLQVGGRALEALIRWKMGRQKRFDPKFNYVFDKIS